MVTVLQDFSKAAYHVANPYAIDVLQTKKKDLVYGIVHTAELLEQLVTEEIVTTQKRSIILATRTRHEQNSRILDVIEANGERACRKFIHPCLKKAEPELYYQICAHVMTLNEHIKDVRRQLIGYLLEQDQDVMQEVIKRNTHQRSNVVFVLKSDSFKKEASLPQLEPAQRIAEKTFNSDVQKRGVQEESQDHNLGTKRQYNAQLLSREQASMENVRCTEAMEEQTSTQETLENNDNTAKGMNLHRAAQEDDWKEVECLLQNGAQIEARDDQNETALFYAVMKGHEKTISTLLKAGANIDSQIINEAIKLNKKSVFKILFDNTGAAVNEEDLNTSVFSAVRQNKDAALSVLIDRGANINVCDEKGYTPLLLSAEMGHSEVFRVLIEKQVHLNATLPNRSTVLHLAVQGGSLPIIEKLLEKGLNPNITDQKLQTPLHVAAALDMQDIVKSLLKAGVQVNATAQDGVTPLHVASQHGNGEIVACLIKNKAKTEAVDKLGRTALHWAATSPKESSIMNELLLAKAKVNALDNEKRSALHLAAMEGKLQTVVSLLTHKGKAGAKDKNGSTPLHYAATGGHVDVVSCLLEALKNKGLEERNTWKKTPLHVAAEKGHVNVVTLLLEAGAKINSKDQNKDTPLHCAVRGGHQEAVRRLVEWGQGSSHKMRADLQATNTVGKTALQLAENGNTPEHESIATLLKRKMMLAK